jgi:hypothetical protein
MDFDEIFVSALIMQDEESETLQGTKNVGFKMNTNILIQCRNRTRALLCRTQLIECESNAKARLI